VSSPQPGAQPPGFAEPRELRLQPLELWLLPGPGALLGQLRAALQAEARRLAGEGAEPLRWAVTALDPERGLRLEGVVVGPGGDSLP
jgi:hypothetical protein